jgi:hypothetical protein
MSPPYLFVDRATWGARRSAGRKLMPRQVRAVYIHHTVIEPSGPEGYDSDLDPTDDPCADMRRTESVLHARGLAPGYSYVIHPSGVVLEGAGRMVGAHTAGHNASSYGISFMGNYDRAQPTLAALLACARTINLLRLDGALPADLARLTIGGHRDTKPTACPGANLYAVLGPLRDLVATG